MNANIPDLEVVFHEALARGDAAEQSAYLDSACAGNAELRKQVEDLLAAHAERGEFLGGTDNATSNYRDHRLDPSLGNVVAGRYKLLETIGEGGMGTVYFAEQLQPVRRKVAVKIIKPGMDSKSVLARFEAERQALALMDHPNIAKVLDAGTTEQGLPFFVMELVKGTPITKFCDERKLSPRERLELFIPICQAIQHAHQKGVIHRDIKPSNVLVALYDERPIPKVIDFGVAKATGQALTEHTLHTGFGAIIGTPEYMSPEQATFNQLDIDTRSDVYALGVLLYELLTGTTPVDKARLGQAAVLEVLRVVREEEPARPSIKLTSTAARASIAATRGTEPEKLSKLLRGELDWIVMKALEKDRNRRYDTATGLARDIQRYLADEIVEARPPSAGYRLRKVVGRNRGAIVAASLVVLALAVGLVGTTWGMVRARGAEQEMMQWYEHAVDKTEEAVVQEGKARLAEEAARRSARDEKALRERAERSDQAAKAAAAEALAVNQFFQYAMLLAAAKNSGANLTLRQFVDTAEPMIETMFKEQPRNESRVRLLFGQMYAHWDARSEAVRQLDRALSRPGLSGAEIVAIQRPAISAYARAGDSEKAVETARRVFDESVKVHGADHFQTLEARSQLATIYDLTGSPAEAQPHWHALVATYQPTALKSPSGLELFIFTSNRLAVCLLAQKKYVDAEQVLLSSLELSGLLDENRKVDAKLQPFVVEAMDLLIQLYDETDQPSKSATWRKRQRSETQPTK